MKKFKKDTKIYQLNNGITMIVLVVIIIVLLILAGITLNLAFGNKGLLSRSKNITEKWSETEKKEKEDLAKLANEMKVEKEDLDIIPPTVEIGKMSKTTAWVNEPVSLSVTLKDNESGIDIEKCIWEYSTECDLIGEDESKYKGGIFKEESETIELRAPGKGKYYLHVLAIDKAGNKTEKISKEYAQINDTLYLYKDGYDSTDITGGFIIAKDCDPTPDNVLNNTNVSISKNSTNMVFSHSITRQSSGNGGGWSIGLISTKNKIDITYFNDLYIEYSFPNPNRNNCNFRSRIFKGSPPNRNNILMGGKDYIFDIKTIDKTSISNIKGDNWVGLASWFYCNTLTPNQTIKITLYSIYLKC